MGDRFCVFSRSTGFGGAGLRVQEAMIGEQAGMPWAVGTSTLTNGADDSALDFGAEELLQQFCKHVAGSSRELVAAASFS